MGNKIFVKEISPSSTQDWVKNGALLVDVREKDEVEQLAYDVPNIINIPLSVFEERFHEVPKDKEVVIVCRGGGRSLKAAGFLISNGYGKDKAVNMQHGIIGWVQKGFPIKGNTSSVLGNTLYSGCCGTSTNQTTQSCCDSSPNSDGSKCC